MGRKRKANLEVEYELERQIKDLQQEISKLKRMLKESDTKKNKEIVVKKVPIKKECPKCGSFIKSSTLPIGTLELCESACGYRNVNKKKEVCSE